MTSIPWINYLTSISMFDFYKIIDQRWIQFLRKYVLLQPIGVGNLEQPGRLVLFNLRQCFLSHLGRALVFGTTFSYIQPNLKGILRMHILSFSKSSITTILDSSDECRMKDYRNGGVAIEYGRNFTYCLGDFFCLGLLNRSGCSLPFCTLAEILVEMRDDYMQVDTIRW